MKYDHILVMGAGAVGGYFGGRIADHTTRKVTLVARGEHLQAIQTRGLEIKSPDGDTSIKIDSAENPSDAEEVDLILFTVKSYDTEAAIEQIKPIVSDDTQILTIQNGIENYGKLKDVFGEERVIQGFCRIGASIKEPGIIEHNSMGSIVVGEQNGNISLRVRALKEVFDETDIEFLISDHIRHDVWVKFAWNSIFNMLTGLAVVTVDKLFGNPYSEQLCLDLYEEIRDVAEADGVLFGDDEKKIIIENSRNLSGFTTSTYNDRKKKKKLEYEAFTGAIVRLAKKHGIPVPHNKTLYALLKLVD